MPMPLNWINPADFSFNSLLLLERVQIAWLPGWLPPQETALALAGNPAVAWFLRHKCPQVAPWLDELPAPPESYSLAELRAAEIAVLQEMIDLLVYACDPGRYDAQPFLQWDDRELTSLVDFTGKIVLDIGSGTGRLALLAAPAAQVVYAVEPVENLRHYLREKARRRGYTNLYAVDGLVTAIPFPSAFADIVTGGHVFGDEPEAEIAELERVTKSGGMIILCPGTGDRDNPAHQALVAHGYAWERFEQPVDGWKRKYWKTI